ncbi:MAG: tetratricopeptide repeat protein [Alphaproteobacteria bacterium]|nr:tetratricopeptide repeat protein [Alphaproteobacteria bacterium]
MSDESIFREVDEEVRAEQFQKLWKNYGAYISGAAIGVVLAVAGIKGWQYYQIKQAETAGEQYLGATGLLSSGKKAEADKIFADIATNGPAGFSALAKFRLAAELAKAGSAAEALKAFDEIANAGSVDAALKNLARVRAALLAVDIEPLDAVEKRVASLNIADGAWRHSAREIIAISAFKNGDLTKADRLYNELASDTATPAGLRQRAQLMIGVISPKLPSGTKPASKPDTADTSSSGSTQ